MTKSVAIKAKNRDWIETLKDFEKYYYRLSIKRLFRLNIIKFNLVIFINSLLEHFDGLIQEPDEQTPLSASKKANCALKPFQVK